MFILIQSVIKLNHYDLKLNSKPIKVWSRGAFCAVSPLDCIQNVLF